MDLHKIIEALVLSRIETQDFKNVIKHLQIENVDHLLNKIIAHHTKILFTSLSEKDRTESRILLSKLVLII